MALVSVPQSEVLNTAYEKMIGWAAAYCEMANAGQPQWRNFENAPLASLKFWALAACKLDIARRQSAAACSPTRFMT